VNLKSKIYLYFLIPIVVITISTVISNIQIKNARITSGWVNHTLIVISEANHLKSLVADLETGQRGYVITGEDKFLDPFVRAKKEWSQKLPSLKFKVADNSKQVQSLVNIDKKLKDWFSVAAYPEINARKNGDFSKASSLIKNETGKKITDELRFMLSKFVKVEEGLLEKRSEADMAQSKAVSYTINTLGFITFLFCAFFAFFFSRDILKALNMLLEGTQKISKGNYLTQVDESRSDELGILAKDFNKMACFIHNSQEELIAANNSKTIFLANMSYEIRTPMNGILGMIDLLRGSKLNPNQFDMIETIRVCGDGLMTILNDILDLSKIETGKISLEETQLNLNKCIEDVIALLSFKAEQKHLELVYDRPENASLWHEGDATRVKQIIVNILSNAIKFTDSGKINIRLEINESNSSVEDQIKIVVNDSGIGISKDAMEQIFHSFSQADSSTTRKYGGTGLGLSISNKLAKLMNGAITVESSEGDGSTFTVSLKLVRTHEGSHSAGVELSRPHYGGELLFTQYPLKILVVEDNEINQKIIKLKLAAYGYPCEMVENGHEAIMIMKEQGPDFFSLIFMDMQMPVMDGVTATEKIVCTYGDQAPPIVAMTANVFTEDRKRCFAAGMVDFVAKPIDSNELKRVLKKFGEQPEKKVA
jgi:signal transduction histidine kinase/CheY-like chemotaxis protein